MTNNIQINNSTPSNLIISNNCCEDENKNNSNFDKFINAKLKSQYILEYNWITFGYIINELANGSIEFRKILENGGFVEKIEAIDINDGKGFTSRLLRLIINIKYTNGINNRIKNSPNKFSLILKIFADERIEILLQHFFGKERLEKVMLKFTDKLTIENNNNEEINDKVVSTKINPVLKESMASFTRMHKNECLFYKMMNDIEYPPLPIPKIYFTKNCREKENEEDDMINKIGPQGVILMEDLTENTHITPLTKGLNEIQIMEVVKYLAHLHAYLSLPKIKGKWQKEFVTIEEMWGQGMAEEFGSAMIEQIMELDEDIVEPFKIIGNLVMKPDFVKWMKEKCENNYGVPEILTHGDLWNNNLLWYNNNPNRLAAFIDWQLATIGNPMTDISRLMLATVEPDLRKNIEKEGTVLELYLNELNKKLVEQGMEKVKYGIEELQHVYNLAIISQAIGRVMEIPFFERGTPENDPEFKEKMECIKIRAKSSINDALKIFEMEAPEWLNKDEEKKGKNI